jgi:hypothetical protein
MGSCRPLGEVLDLGGERVNRLRRAVDGDADVLDFEQPRSFGHCLSSFRSRELRRAADDREQSQAKQDRAPTCRPHGHTDDAERFGTYVFTTMPHG